MNGSKKMILSDLIGGLKEKIFDYKDLADYICREQAGQRAFAESAVNRLRDAGRLNISDDSPFRSREFNAMLSAAKVDVISRLREDLEDLEYIETMLLLCNCRPTLLTAKLNDIITTLAQSDIEMKNSDWAVVCMLCDESGKRLTPTELIESLRNNKITNKKPIASRESLKQAYITYEPEDYFPNWPQKTAKQRRYYKLATLIKPLIDVLDKK